MSDDMKHPSHIHIHQNGSESKTIKGTVSLTDIEKEAEIHETLPTPPEVPTDPTDHDSSKLKDKILKLFGGLFILSLMIIAGLVFYPNITEMILKIFWAIIFTLVIIFLGVGILVMVGMRKEASRILDILLERSLSILDVKDFIEHVFKEFIRVLQDMLMFLAPAMSYAGALIVYVVLLLVYKTVGRTNDVTLMTIIITIIMVAIVSWFNSPGRKTKNPYRWTSRFLRRINQTFADGLEVAIFIFFITMDSERLFLLPESLKIPLKSQIGNYDLMTRSLSNDQFIRITIIIIVLGAGIEIFRNILRIFAMSLKFYRQYTGDQNLVGSAKSSAIKHAIRRAASYMRDDTLKFIVYTTVLVWVFLFFPRLKLVAVLVASLTGLIIDFIIPARLTAEKGEDLIGRILAKVFRL